jgi:hypothetical protein
LNFVVRAKVGRIHDGVRAIVGYVLEPCGLRIVAFGQRPPVEGRNAALPRQYTAGRIGFIERVSAQD